MDVEAVLKGYLYFNVNGQTFFRYTDARAHKNMLKADDYPISFTGYHIRRGWESFYIYAKVTGWTETF